MNDHLVNLDGDGACVDVDIGALEAIFDANTSTRDLSLSDRKRHSDNNETTDLYGTLGSEDQDVLRVSARGLRVNHNDR